VAGVIGDPVTHSLSPALHNAALKELGLDWAYVAFPVPTGHARAAVAAMADLGIRGLSVTMPHKADAAAACHRLNAVAARLGVVNTVTNVSGELVGDSTDGGGFVDSLADQGWYPAGKRCLVLGAGGAARAVVLALAEAGAARVDVVARRPEQAMEVAAFAGAVGTTGWVEAAAEADLVVNATPVGMGGVGKGTGAPGGNDPGPTVGERAFVDAYAGEPQRDASEADGVPGVEAVAAELPFGLDPERLGAGQLVVDLIYAPAATPLLLVARAQGADTCNGLGMLIHQAARQVTIWTGREAPIAVMSAAALRELGKRAELGQLGELAQLGEPVTPT
jgi:shikimate dehydrogenase